MRKILQKLLYPTSCIILISCAHAETLTRAISKDSVNLSTERFYNSFISKDAGERNSANLYLLGVMDSTEGDLWCNYTTFKTTTLRAKIYEDLKKSDDKDNNTRASTVIKQILKNRYPCKGEK